jgi:hypothetical protein
VSEVRAPVEVVFRAYAKGESEMTQILTDDEREKNLAAFVKVLGESIDRKPLLQQATDDQIADVLLHFLWAKLPAFSLESDLVQQAIDRLRARSSVPDLLEACKAARARLGDPSLPVELGNRICGIPDAFCDMDFLRAQDVDDHNRAIKQLDNAIAKAEPAPCETCSGSGAVVVTSSDWAPEHGSIEQESCPECHRR